MIMYIYYKVSHLEQGNIETYKFLSTKNWAGEDYLEDYIKEHNPTPQAFKTNWLFGNGDGVYIMLDPNEQDQVAGEVLECIYAVVSDNIEEALDCLITKEEMHNLYAMKPREAEEQIKRWTPAMQYNVLYYYYGYKYEILEVW